MSSCNRGECVSVWCAINSCHALTPGFNTRNDLCVLMCILILGLVLGEKVEVFAQWAGELWHFFAAVVGGTWGVALSLLNSTVHLGGKEKKTCWFQKCIIYQKSSLYSATAVWKNMFTCTNMSARWVSLAWRRSAELSSWINQDPLLVFRMAAVPWGGTDQTAEV